MIYQFRNGYYVRGLQLTDLDGPYMSWFEDQEICKYNSHGKFFKTKEYFHSFIAALNREDSIVWAICHEQDGHIGNVSLQAISLIHRHAEFAILLGARTHWNKGVGQEVGRQLLHHGFSKLNLQRIYCATAANNLGMRKLAQGLGMREEGVRKRHFFIEGEWTDMVEFGVLREEYTGIKA